MGLQLGPVRRRPAVRGLTCALFLLTVSVLGWQLVRLWEGYQFRSPGAKDFIDYWCAGQLLWHGENPYDFGKLCRLEAEHGVPPESQSVVWNPPWLLVWICPLLLLPFGAAAVAWLVLSGATILASAGVVWRTFAGPSPPNRALPAAWVAAFAFFPTLSTLGMGQVSSLLLLGVAGFLCSASRRRDYLAGAFLALTTIKPHVLYLFWVGAAWWVIAERRWKVAAGFCALLLPTLAILTLLWPEWLTGYRTAMAEPPLYWITPTVGGMLRFWVFPTAPQVQFLPPLVFGLALLGCLLVKRPSLDWRAAAGPLLLASVPTAAYGWSFDQIVLLVPYLELIRWVADGRIKGTRKRALVIAALVALIVATLGQGLLVQSEHFFFWPPLALAAVYAYAWRCRQSVREASLGDKAARPFRTEGGNHRRLRPAADDSAAG
jgi:hypothetical protein